MIMIQFREDVHKENMHLLHNIKKDMAKLCENLEKEEEANFGERRYIIDQFDRRDNRDRMGGDMGERRGGGRMGRREAYPEYPFDERNSGRYDY